MLLKYFVKYKTHNRLELKIFIMKRYCLALDLVDDPVLIKEYENYHKNVWKEITASIKGAGISDMEIYRIGNRLFMIMETKDDFSFDKKNAMDASNPKVQEWEQ